MRRWRAAIPGARQAEQRTEELKFRRHESLERIGRFGGESFEEAKTGHQRLEYELFGRIQRLPVAVDAGGLVARLAQTLGDALGALDLLGRDLVAHAHRGDDGGLDAVERHAANGLLVVAGAAIEIRGAPIRRGSTATIDARSAQCSRSWVVVPDDGFE